LPNKSPEANGCAFGARYEVRPRRNRRGVDLISDVLPFGRLWVGERDAIRSGLGWRGAAKFERARKFVGI